MGFGPPWQHRPFPGDRSLLYPSTSPGAVWGSLSPLRLYVHFDHATITIVGEVFVGTEEQLTSSMSNPAMESDIARMVVSGIMEDPLGLSVLRDYL